MASGRALLVCVLAAAVATGDSLDLRRSRRVASDDNPVTKVVHLLEEMKSQAEAEAKEDGDAYNKMACWCQTNDRDKTEAIKIAQARIDELGAAIETGTAKAAELEGEIATLKDDIQENQDSIDKAVAIRAKEQSEFEAEDKDLSDSVAALKEAVVVLSKVQLVQSQAGQHETVVGSLVQVRSIVDRVVKAATLLSGIDAGMYKSVMQKDLWDLMSSYPGSSSSRLLTGLDQEQQPTGAAAGAKSYNARSGQIVGMLTTMKAEFEKNLALAQKNEVAAVIAFQRLRSAKEGEILAAGKSLDEKTAALADTNQKVAQAKTDIEDTRAALSADQKFLMDLKSRCKTADDEFSERSSTRQDEIAAIGETIKILTEDASRDLFSKTIASLVQTGSRRHRRGVGFALTQTKAVQRKKAQAVKQLLALAKRHSGTAGGWRLATLAVGVQLDGFEKVKELMDKMVTELKKQQKEEYEKNEACKNDIDTNEDDTRSKAGEQKDTQATISSIDGKLAQLVQDLQDLATQIAEAHVSLKAAGEDRKAENHVFQQTVADQRATVTILTKAIDRLREFYAGKGKSLLAIRSHRQEPVPGAAAPPPPAAGKSYSKSGAATGVMSIIEKIIQDAETADKEAVSAEQESQNAYAQFVANTNEVLDAASTATTEKTIAKEKAEAEKLTSSKNLKMTETAIDELSGQNQALHLGCDYLLKNMAIRQQGRQDEIEAIQEAKAILSGADLGGEDA